MVTFIVASASAQPPPSTPPSVAPVEASNAVINLSAAQATLLVGVTAALITLATTALVGRRESRRYRVEFATRQLNELYAPIKLLLAQDAVLANQLKGGSSDGKHLLEDVNSILADAGRLAIAKQIVAINRKISGVLESKSGLCSGPIPVSFSKFLGHYYMLDRAVSGEPFVPNAEFEYFPKQFEQDIDSGYESLRTGVVKGLGPWYRRR
ncbi:hypothetical protein [Amycolatopsis vastitatis]|uniref:hypothetical protein n=1 Tax=Amycolatopsis vastitatis TaxID=1905142 RepID=UPI001177EC5E|nr:hypothetical protein [Amycolatopsis vastitatis]